MQNVTQRAVDRGWLFLLAAILCFCCFPAKAIRPDSLQNRVGGCDHPASGQTSAAASQTLENAMGYGGCGYKIVPGRARWLNRDPIGEARGINLYGFVGNNPVNLVDPHGLDFWQSQNSIVYQGPPISSYTGNDVANGVDEITSAAVQSAESTSTTGNFAAYMTQSLVSGTADLLRLGQGTADATTANNGYDQAIGIAQDVVRATGLFDLLAGIGIDAVPKPQVPKPKVQCEMGKQGKHIPGHNNYIPGRSPLTYPDPQALLDKFAGKGQPVNDIPRGQPGFKERVDFGEVIGEYDGQPTTKGMINYSQNGAHIVPARP